MQVRPVSGVFLLSDKQQPEDAADVGNEHLKLTALIAHPFDDKSSEHSNEFHHL